MPPATEVNAWPPVREKTSGRSTRGSITSTAARQAEQEGRFGLQLQLQLQLQGSTVQTPVVSKTICALSGTRPATSRQMPSINAARAAGWAPAPWHVSEADTTDFARCLAPPRHSNSNETNLPVTKVQ
ncbi:hypothetical protein RLT58_34920 [Streptomyces sp. ITFR-16]|nr:hypothetical protein [Streptomyces sp. ITFR-16]WNI26750.1 hypothetical protein RLT58_34920 [Streptomyces sp. ITFR-16]